MPYDKHTAREWLIKSQELGSKRATQFLEYYNLPLSQYPNKHKEEEEGESLDESDD